VTSDLKSYIYRLDDEQLVLRMVELDTKLLPPTMFGGFNEKPQLTDWERNFIAGIQTFWARRGGITWKQRRMMRLTLLDVCEREVRRQQLLLVRQAIVKTAP
jgi:hypothetical protein